MGKILPLDLEDQLQGGLLFRNNWVGECFRIH